MHDAIDSPSPGLIYTGRLPLAWRELSAPPDDAEQRELEQANVAILQTLFALEIHSGDHGDDPTLLANASELKRLDFKVSLLLELVGHLFARQQGIPPERPLTLTVNDIAWQADSALPAGGPVRLELYCSKVYPRPLILHARVTEAAPADNGCRISAAFFQPGMLLQEALERYIFLQHRRAIASSRGHRPR